MKRVLFGLAGVGLGLIFWLLFVLLMREGIAARVSTRNPTQTTTVTPASVSPAQVTISATAPLPASATPFQPRTFTPTPSLTPSPTSTPTHTATPPPTATPELPDSASIENISGRWPALSLDCESRSAVDWAAYFGVTIDELGFFNGLPQSDNPETGFVGNVHAPWGQIPPNDYGVHARPVARLLRAYGLKADAVHGLSWEALRAEIAAGQPVMVWVIGRVGRGTPVPYTASDGTQMTVARFEHTVLVIGYDKSQVTVLDGNWVYQRSISDFLDSWGVLGNMAVIWTENP